MEKTVESMRNFHFHPELDLGQVTSIHLHLHFSPLNWDNAAPHSWAVAMITCLK